MSEPTRLDPFEQRLSDAIRQHASAARDARPAAEIAADAMRGNARRRQSAQGRRRLLLLGLAAVLLLPVGLFAAGGGSVFGPPSPSVAPDPSGGHYGVVLRTVAGTPRVAIDVVLVRSDGQERVVRRLHPSELEDGAGFGPYGEIAQDGWLAVHARDAGSGSDYFVLLDLPDPARPLRYVRYAPVMGGAWGIDGRFATTCPGNFPGSCLTPNPEASRGWSIQVVDARSGSRTVLSGLELPGGGPSLFWAADGSGIVTSMDPALREAIDNGLATDPPPDTSPWGVAPADGSAWRPGFTGILGGSSWVSPAGAILDPNSEGGGVTVTSADGHSEVWYRDDLPGTTFGGASFSGDGSFVWVVTTAQVDGRTTATLSRVEEPRKPEIVATVPIGSATWAFPAGPVAPDDSMILVRVDDGSGTLLPFIRAGRDGAISVHDGNPIGFVPAAVADGWGGEAFHAVPDAAIPGTR